MNRVPRPGYAALAALALRLLLAAAAFRPGLAAALDLSGIWQLNVKQSDDARDKLREAMRAARAYDERDEDDDGGPGGPGYGSAPMPHRRHHDEDDVGPGARMPMLGASRIQITQQGPEISLVYDGRASRVLYTDGRGTTVTASGSMTEGSLGQSIASYSGDELHVETNPGLGPIIYENFSLLANGAQLKDSIRLESPTFAKPVEIVRVYDRVPGN